jgi:hypothetical protein
MIAQRIVVLALSACMASGALAGAAEGPNVAVKMPTSTHPELKAGGFGDLLAVDLIEPIEKSCNGKAVEWMRRKDVLREIELQQGPEFDPKTRVATGQLLQPDIFIESSLRGDSASFEYTLVAVDAITGDVITQERVSGKIDDFFKSTEPAMQRLVNKMCDRKAGYIMEGVMDEATIKGTICGPLDRPFTATSPEVAGTWNFTPAGSNSGSFKYTAQNVGGAKGMGSGTYTIVPGANGAAAIRLKGTGSVQSPFGTFSAPITESIKLTPAKTCGRIGSK